MAHKSPQEASEHLASFVENLRRLDQSYQSADMCSERDREIWATLQENARSPGDARAHFKSRWAAALALTCAAGATAFVMLRQGPDAPKIEREISGFVVRGDECGKDSAPGALRLKAGCEARPTEGPSLAIKTERSAEVRRIDRGVTMTQGSAHFDVTHVAPGDPPTEVQVPGGAIFVLGTDFEVTLGESAGAVHLYEGRIEFRGHDGTKRLLSPGESHRWSLTQKPTTEGEAAQRSQETVPVAVPPLPSEPQTLIEPQALKHEAQGAQAFDRDHLAHLTQLRREGKYGEAERLLRDFISRGGSNRSQELLHFELGDVMTRGGASGERLCHHWGDFLHRFPESNRAHLIEGRLLNLKCAAPKTALEQSEDAPHGAPEKKK